MNKLLIIAFSLVFQISLSADLHELYFDVKARETKLAGYEAGAVDGG